VAYATPAMPTDPYVNHLPSIPAKPRSNRAMMLKVPADMDIDGGLVGAKSVVGMDVSTDQQRDCRPGKQFPRPALSP
jgi:hypothetical protein